VAVEPLRAAAYLGILVAFCAVFSVIWLEVGGLGPGKWRGNSWIRNANSGVPPLRETIETMLKRYIPVVTVLGGIVVGLIAGYQIFLEFRFRNRYLTVSGHNLPVL